MITYEQCAAIDSCMEIIKDYGERSTVISDIESILQLVAERDPLLFDDIILFLSDIEE